MKRIYEFKCSTGTVSERYIDETEKVITCDCCGTDAHRIISLPLISLEGITGAFPDAAAKWERVRKEHLEVERKRNS